MRGTFIMPELPEVETVVRGLRKNIIGKQIIETTIFHERPLGTMSPEIFCNKVEREVIERVERFGKYIHIIFASKRSIVSHLRMTGKYIYLSQDHNKNYTHKHIRIAFLFADQSSLLYKDVRIFGTIRFYEAGEVVVEKVNIGMDPFSKEITTDWFVRKAHTRHISVKQLLLDQKVIAGLGNIYASEILFRAGVSPFQKAHTLTTRQASRIIQHMRDILKLAIKYNGTSVSDFRTIDDKSGSFQNMLQVYQKDGTLCVQCHKTEICKVRQAQRSTFYCPVCQKMVDEKE
jgi:formamidopyrimidine-DNA glycosylase